MGYEYGFRRRLDPVRTTPEDWHSQRAEAEIDLTGFLAEANAFKRDTTVLGTAGPLRRVSAPNGRVVGLLRLDAGSTLAAGSEALTLVNPDLARPDGIDLGPLLTAAGGRIAAFADQTPGVPPLPFVAGTPITLDPLGVRLFVGHADATEGRAPTPEVTQKRLEESRGQPGRDRAGDARARRRPLPGQAHRRRRADGRGRHLRRRPRQAGRRHQVPAAPNRRSGRKSGCGSSTTTAGPAASR